MSKMNRYKISLAYAGSGRVQILVAVLLSLLTVSVLEAQYTSHGKLKPFWRYSAALGGYPNFHENGQSLVEVPDYLCTGNDFTYVRRPYAMENLFADHLSVVRLLGGHASRLGAAIEEVAQQDLAYRVQHSDGTTQVVYRMELVEKRLRPYLDAGYTDFTFVLDNIPWGMTDDPEDGNLGNVGIPCDFSAWENFIAVLCEEILNVCGPEICNKIRFRAGTEFQETKRYAGNGDEDFMSYYNASWRGISRVFPEASFGPFNIAGVSVYGMKNRHHVNAFNIPALKDENAPFDWVSYSHYFLPGEGNDSLIKPFVDTWNEFSRLYPELEFTKEIHEFGMQPWKDNLTNRVHQEPGASGIATTVHTLLGLWNEGLEKCWHWSVFDQYFNERGSKILIPKGIAWIYSVLDRMEGGEACYLESINRSSRGTLHTGLYSQRNSEVYVLLNAYNPDITEHAPETATFQIPKDAMAPLDLSQIRFTAANKDTVVHDIMYKDLKDADLLYPFFRNNAEYRGLVKEMAFESDPDARTREGSHFLAANNEKYIQIWDESLTLKSIEQRSYTITDNGDYYAISIEMSPPEALVLQIPLVDNMRNELSGSR